MFQFTKKPSSGSQSQYLAKITSLVQLDIDVTQMSVLWRHSISCMACVLCTMQAYMHSSYMLALCTTGHTMPP